MNESRLTLSIDLRWVLVAVLTLIVHMSVMGWRLPQPQFDLSMKSQRPPIRVTRVNSPPDTPLPAALKQIRKIGEQDGKGQNQVLASRGVRGGRETTQPNPFKAAGFHSPSRQVKAPAVRRAAHPYRPTSRPTALDQLTQQSEPIQKVASRTQHAGAMALAGSPTLSKSLMNMQVEVPEGVKADELNEFELQFYGFQNRLVSKYLNSIELQVREYEKRYALQTLNVEGKHVMTGRVTFDSDGNIKQIKMLRWTQADRLQSLFEDILKSMVSLPNPPKILRNPEGEFVVFYTLTVNNT